MDTLQKLFLSKDSLNKIKLLDESQEDIDTKNIDIGPIKPLSSDMIIGRDVFNDVELVTSYTGDYINTVFSKIDCTYMHGSKEFLKTLLLNPIDDIEILMQRQDILNRHGKNAIKLGGILKEMTQYESDVAWMYSHRDEEITMLYDMVFFTNVFVKPLNNIDAALTSYNIYRIVLSPLIGIFTPIFYFIIPYIVVRIKLGVDVGFFQYMKLMFSSIFSGGAIGTMFPKMTYLSAAFSLIFYFQGLFNSVEVAKACYKISKLITNRMHGVSKFISLAKSMDEIWEPSMSTVFFEETIENKFHDSSFECSRFDIYTNFGKSLRQFKNLDREKMLILIRKVYIIDSINSIFTLKSDYGFSYSKYERKKLVPTYNVKGLWHPSLDNTLAVKNDVLLENKSLILTGPNAGGKSTLIKSMLLSILFAQTITLTNSNDLTLSPFSYINSQINIPDCKGKESLFEAEMHRSKENLDILKNFGKFSIMFMDELLTSTNAIEGISGAYAIAKKISDYENSMLVITTHYLWLTKLAKDTKKFTNYCMKVDIDTKGSITFPYKIIKGVSRQFIALELLKKNGFDTDITDLAIQIKNRLLK